MSVLGEANPKVSEEARRAVRPQLVGLGTAVPHLCMEQSEIAARLAAVWGLRGSQLRRWQRIIAGTAIDTRCGVMPIEEVVALSTMARMEAYERHAPALAERAVAGALDLSGIEPSRVTDLIVVSCTGFWAPGLDVEVVQRLGLPTTVRRMVVGFMGCFGAIIGLRAAVGACRADPGAVAVVVCLELCSLHLRSDLGAENLVASALFGDGAAAAIVCGTRAARAADGPNLCGLTMGHSRLLSEGRDWMSWRITDSGFAMTLTRDVPAALASRLGAIVDEVCPRRPDCYIVHPGGAGILDAVDQGLGLGGRHGLDAARGTLRRYGNMSSATVLFALAEAFQRGYRPPAMILAFGPGLAVEMMALYR